MAEAVWAKRDKQPRRQDATGLRNGFAAAVCVVFYLLLLSVTLVRARPLLGGHFIYALDDPYIHLALAENLAHGHYGINAGEFASPSSSLIWPFLLLPFAGTRWHVFVPFAWNILFGVAAAGLMGWMLGRWPPVRSMPRWQAAVTGGLLIFCTNLPGLTVVGMEHTLQVLLAICCAFGVVEALRERPVPFWCLGAAALAPAVRYEGLALTLALCVALAGQRRLRAGLLVLGLSLLPLLGLALFLVAHGLPPVPLSVLVKAQSVTAGPLGHPPVTALKELITATFTSYDHLPILLLTLTLAGLARTAKTQDRRFAFAGAAALGALQLAVGRFNWLHRYEVYALIFLLLVVLHALGEQEPMLFGWFAMGLALIAGVYVDGFVQLPAAMADIYDQQYQMHRFVTEYYAGNYAVNDLGLTSFDRRPGTYVLDLWGLGSLEAARHPDKSAAWLSEIVARKQVPLAMVFPKWFHIPTTWQPVAEICIVRAITVLVPDRCVVFYATEPAAVAGLEADMARFAPTVPRDVEVHFASSKSGVWSLLPAGKLP